MKKLLYFTLTCVSFLALTHGAKAQTSVEILSVYDSLPYHCDPPAYVGKFLSGITKGYASLDSIEVHVDFGDGNDTVYKNEVYSSGGDSAYFWTYFDHTYITAGEFNAVYTVSGPDGSFDIYNEKIVIDAICSGYLSINYYTTGLTQCSPDNPINLYVYGDALNYNSTDSINVKINFGDGNNVTFYTPIYSSSYYYANYTYTYSVPGTYTIQYIVIGSDGKSDTAAGTIVVNNTCASISGTLYLDNNNDCSFNSGDDYLSGLPVYLKSGGSTLAISYTDAQGKYYFTGITGTTYTVEIMYADSSYYNYYTSTCPSSGSVTFTAGSSNVNNFAFSCDNSAFDLQGNLSGWGFRPGFDGYIYMDVFNPKCLPVSGTATLTLDPLLTYTGTSYGTPPTTNTGNTLTWDFTNLENNFNWYWGLYSYIQVATSLSAQIGDSVCLTLSITPTSGDENPANNSITQCFEVRNSYDPNMKEVAPKGTGASGDVAQDTDFTYKVHFQNTGNDVAYNIHIIDTIDEDLDMSTLRIISSSHNMNPYIIAGNVVKFDFPNIMLADSTSNEPESHGIVVYKIKAKPSLAYGTQFKNTAHIYFDFNPAIVTNTTVNTIPWPLNVKEHSAGTMEVFPNPTSGIVKLSFEKTFSGIVTVTDVLGKTVMQVNVSGASANLDLSILNAGLYTITANNSIASMQNKVAVFK